MKILDTGITTPKGFKAAGQYVGLKKRKKDLAIIYSEVPALCSAVFTRNSIKSAPVILGQETLAKENKISAIIINSGSANACTGDRGYEDAKTTAAVLAKKLNVDSHNVLVSSTGVIGVYLDMNVLLTGIDALVPALDSDEEAAQNCAEAIMTTDTIAKSTAVEIDINGVPVRIAGICKGSGMIHPRMATLLCYLTTDIDISKPLLDKAFRESIGKSFNRITIDGAMSTNDTAVILANGVAKNEKIMGENEYYHRFKEALEYVCIDLAKKIVSDGEGATKLIQIDVRHSKSEEDAHLIFEAVATSTLVKTAFFGEDANWGRIVAAMGISGASFDMQKMTLTFRSRLGEILLFKDGIPDHFDGSFAKEILKEKAIEVIIDLHDGAVDITGWTCDLSYDYVKINASYRS